MTNTIFNELWDRLHKTGRRQAYIDHGEKLILSLSEGRYGSDVVLESQDDDGTIYVVLVHWDKERFRRILVY